MAISLKKLKKTEESRLPHTTYISTCGEKTYKNTKWLIPSKFIFKKKKDTKVLESVMDGTIKVAVKVRNIEDDFDKTESHLEMIWNKKLSGENNFVNTYCDIICNDDILKNDSIVPKTFCSGKGQIVHIIIQEFIKGKNIGKFKFNSLSILESILYQLLLAYIVVNDKHDFMHLDFLSSGNIIITKTDKKTIKYIFKGTNFIVKTNGYYPIILDFGRATKAPQKYQTFNDLREMYTKLIQSLKNNKKTQDELRRFIINTYEKPMNSRDIKLVLKEVMKQSKKTDTIVIS